MISHYIPTYLLILMGLASRKPNYTSIYSDFAQNKISIHVHNYARPNVICIPLSEIGLCFASPLGAREERSADDL